MPDVARLPVWLADQLVRDLREAGDAQAEAQLEALLEREPRATLKLQGRDPAREAFVA